MRTLLLAGSILALAVPAHADANGDLVTLVNDVWANALKEQPVYASALGVNDYASELGDYTLAAQDRRAADAAKFLARLNAIPSDSLNAASKVEAGILRRALNSTIEGNSFGQRAINFTTYSSWHQQLAGMAQNLPFRTKTDFESYNARLAQYARVNDENIAVANVAIKGKYTQPCVTLKGFEGTISGLITTDVNKSRFYEPYAGKRPAGISEADFASLAKAAEATIRTVIHPALNKQLAWYTASYKPACATAPGVSAQPGGAKYYASRVREETTTSLTAEQIHQIGLNEVARIRAEMVEVASKAGYPSREAFIQHLRTDPQYYAKTPEELMEKVARVTKIIDGKMPSLFGRLPRLPYGIKEIPAETAEGTTTAYYNQGSPEIGISGTYFVNTSKLNQRPFWEIPALSVHEGVPGHHHQIALQQELPLSDFRKYGAFFTAFTEGWGLYSERLGIEMGLYDTPAKDMGRLSYEMWRACRLVVDTGIHAKGWSKQQAIDFMTDNSALSAANIEAEVNRYISWPGQALAYKLGELKIRELRAMATKELGPKFNLAAFHDAVLGQGSVPLDVLEQQIKDWVAAEKAKG
ncbi:DUF885 domain-containing protein [Sphingorhabdus sp.]|jgi:uncharacterized protein (DUF885 family)|uniref:DUF885 domain-containing protein n=1 Tax=Sphingorhabdus sp. TaxID=1902408 RepID=UPI0037C75CAB